MTQDEHEHYKHKLDEQLQAGIELLKAAHAQQVRALDLVWMMSRNEEPERTAVPAATKPSAVPATTAPAQASHPSRRGAWDLINDVERALASLPEVFDRNDVLQALGYDPGRGSLYRTLRELIQEGAIAVELPGRGRIPARYRKTGGSPTQPES